MDAVPRAVSAPGFLSPGGSRLWTVPAGAPFLDSLARAICASVDIATAPDALADGVIYVPNRRSARALALALYEAAGGGAILMPQIRALGDLETDDAPPGADAALMDLGPALPQPRRIGALMMLIKAWYDERGEALPTRAAHAAARELAGLIDEAAIAGNVDWSQLETLVAGSDLAVHWDQSIKFLTIITEAWPDWLAAHKALDPLARRLRAAEAIADQWTRAPPGAPVIIAGSTGATPASRILMSAAARLPLGAVVLPGLDTAMTPADVSAVAGAPSHPQYALVHTLSAFSCAPGDVPVLPGATSPAQDDRRALIHESLLPVDQTGDWTSRLADLSAPRSPKAFASSALEGLDLIAARDETEEAMVAACLMRAALEREGETAALVTPDTDLARRVSALLARWDVHVAPSEGIDLLHTEAGGFFDAALTFWRTPDAPVAIAALLHAPHVARPAGWAAFERWVLHGVKWWDVLGDLDARVEARLRNLRMSPSDEEIAGVLETVRWLITAAQPFDGLDTLDIETLRGALREAIPRIADPATVWRGTQGSQLAQLIDQLSTLGDAVGASPLEDWQELSRIMAADIKASPARAPHPRLTILGTLEARLQQADHLILAGLNEDVWPRRSGAETFLPRHFREKIGLPDPEELMGLAAHDFAGLACSPRVSLLYSKRREDAPAVASRWVWRLQTLARGALGAEAGAMLGPAPEVDPREWARALEKPLRDQPAGHARPRPLPPVDARPKKLSVTRIEQLVRDPYATYAEQVLRLNALDPIDMALDARQTGTAVHAALEHFNAAPGMGADGLLARLEAELREAGEAPESIAGRRAVLADISAWYVDWFTTRQGEVASAVVETKGELILDLPGEAQFKLTAQADRIEIKSDGTLDIIDFKTGAPPSDKEVAAGFASQMPLQALIARAGGFETVSAATVSALTYMSFRARPGERIVGQGRDLQATPTELADEALSGLTDLITAYLNAEQPYLSAPRVKFIKFDQGYDRLARRAEWTSEVGND